MSDLTEAKKETWGNYIVRLLVREIQSMKKGDMSNSKEFADLVANLDLDEDVSECIGKEAP